MNISITTSTVTDVEADWLVLVSPETPSESGPAAELNHAMSGAISAANDRGDFKGKPRETLTFFQASGVASKNVVVVGVGAIEECCLRCFRQSLLTALRSCCKTAAQTVAIAFDSTVTERMGALAIAELCGDCVTTAPTDADVYKADRSRFPFETAKVLLPGHHSEAEAAITAGSVIGDACNLVKDLVNHTAEHVNPITFTERAVSISEELGLECLVLDDEQLAREKMGAMLAVARGSAYPARMVKLTYQGAADAPTLALVGKGVTFDSGGYSIKPSASMVSMKADMAGAATVLGIISAVAKLKLPVNVTAYLGLVENMISGDAYRLGDVLTARNGTTVEIHNTDAEGRLVLADVLNYAADDGAAKLIDFATLTGACVVALGEEVTGMFPNNPEMADEITAAAEEAGEFVWPMPMHAHFAPLLKSSVADCKNVGPRWGGAVTAAKFLEKFVNDTPWVHLDIAGPSWADSSSSWQDSGATAEPLRTIVQLLR